MLSPRRSECTLAALDWSLLGGGVAPLPLRSAAARALADNAMADAVLLFEVLALQDPAALRLPLSATLAVRVALAALA